MSEIPTYWYEQFVFMKEDRDELKERLISAQDALSAALLVVEALKAQLKQQQIVYEREIGEWAGDRDALKAELTTVNDTIHRTWRSWVGRDYQHLPLNDAVGAIVMSLTEDRETLKADAKVMAEALLEAHVKTWILADAINIAGKY